jgi:cell division protein FtsW (lipid II flippase)
MAFKQGISMAIGIVLYFAVSQFNIDVFRNNWKWVLGGCTVLILLLRTPLGKSISGNRAWLQIPHLSAFTIQPAEINKIFFAILLSHLIVYLRRERRLNHILSIGTMGGLLLYFVGLYYVISGDMGSCLIFVAIFIVMLWTGGVSPLWFAAGLGTVIPAFLFLWQKIPADNYQKSALWCFLTTPTTPRAWASSRSTGCWPSAPAACWGRAI